MALGPIVTTPATLDLEALEGSSFERILTFGDSVRASDFSFRGSIKKSYKDRVPLARFGFEIVGDQVVRMYLTPTESSKLSGTHLVYDVEMFSRVGNVDVYVARIIQGKMKVSPEVTTSSA